MLIFAYEYQINIVNIFLENMNRFMSIFFDALHSTRTIYIYIKMINLITSARKTRIITKILILPILLHKNFETLMIIFFFGKKKTPRKKCYKNYI